ncbi:MAG: class I SAM-dependent methyltransferase [Cytophagales bacterium]|nr:class I SAM-dependent methyltransferase [Cytophagales bacterium]
MSLQDSVQEIEDYLKLLQEKLSNPAGLSTDKDYIAFAKALIPIWMPTYRQFEKIASEKPLNQEEINQVRTVLHPLLLNAPFVARAFKKPRGYAGDYEMMNMILKPAPLGNSPFEKVVHLLNVLPGIPQSVRNRSDRMLSYIQESHQKSSQTTRILSLACGPAWELERFLTTQPEGPIEILLIDHDPEALEFASRQLNQVADQHQLDVHVETAEASLLSLLRYNRSGNAFFKKDYFDLVYSAGIMDYLKDNICKELIQYLWQFLRKDGMFFTTNMHPSNPEKAWMNVIFDWPLIYRDFLCFEQLSPYEHTEVFADDTGINLFMTMKKNNVHE